MSLDFTGADIVSSIIASVGLAIGTGLAIKGRIDSKNAHDLIKKYHGFEARQKIDDTVNSFEINLTKRDLVKEYWRLIDVNAEKGIKDPKITFTHSNDEVKNKVLQLENSFNKVCSWYQKEEWVDKEDFEKVIGGYICNTWELLRDEIINHQEISKNKNFCKHFQEVAYDFQKMGHIEKVPLYRMGKSKKSD